MTRAVSGPQNHQPGALEQVSYLTSLERTQPTISQMPPIVQPRMEVQEIRIIRLNCLALLNNDSNNMHIVILYNIMLLFSYRDSLRQYEQPRKYHRVSRISYKGNAKREVYYLCRSRIDTRRVSKCIK